MATRTVPGDTSAVVVAQMEVKAFHELEQLVAKPTFLAELTSAANAWRHRKGDTQLEAQPHPELAPIAVPPGQTQSTPSEGLDSSLGTWEHAEPPITEEDAAALADRGFVLVEQDDALNAVAYYLAQCITRHPEAQRMSPKQLQDAVTMALKGMKQSRFKQLLSLGRHVYRWSALSYSALQMYQNPWLIQAVITALWTFSRMTVRAFL